MVEWISEHKSISIGGGIAVLTMLGQIFSDTVKQHPHWAFASGFVAVGMIGIPLVSPLFAKSNKDAAGQTNQTGRNNSGRMINAHIYNESTATPAPAPSIPLSKRANLVALEIKFPENREVMLPQTDLYERVCILPVRNEIPLGGETCNADSVCASIDFTWAGVHIGYTDRTFWSNQEGNEITIQPQQIAGVVLGRYSDWLWHYFFNPQQHQRGLYDHMSVSD